MPFYQHDDGNLRYQTNNSSTLSRRLNTNRLTDYQLSNINEHRDLLSERGVYRDQAAAKIQAAYRGYSVRKSLPWLNDKQKHSDDEFNHRVKQNKNVFRIFSKLFFLFFFSQIAIEKQHQSILIYV
jgi:hypothetical protein